MRYLTLTIVILSLILSGCASISLKDGGEHVEYKNLIEEAQEKESSGWAVAKNAAKIAGKVLEISADILSGFGAGVNGGYVQSGQINYQPNLYVQQRRTNQILLQNQRILQRESQLRAVYNPYQ